MTRFNAARTFWNRLNTREQRMVLVAGALLALAAVWGLGVAPALRTVRAAPAQLEALAAQRQSMEKLAAQAKALQSRPAVGRDEALRVLELSLQQRLGAAAQLSVAGDRVTVSLKAAAPDVLAQWLGQVRTDARVTARQAGLTRGPNGWDGTVVLDLPPA